MGKIPVGRTIAQTYAFAFRNYFTNLGAVWVPFLLFGAVMYFVMLPALSSMATSMSDIAQHARQQPGVPYLPASFGQAMRGLVGSYIAMFFIFPLAAVGVTKGALGTREAPWFVYLAVGKRELLVLGGIFLIIALYVAAIVALGIVGGIVGAIVALALVGTSGGHAADPTAAAANIVAAVRIGVLLFYIVFAYFGVRLAFLMVPVTTVEGRFGVWRSWQLTKGNFWRSLGVILGVFLPITIVSYAIWLAAVGPAQLQQLWDSQVHAAHAQALLSAEIGMLTKYGLYYWIGGFVLAPISYGLMFGQSAFAYRALTSAGGSGVGPKT